MNIKEQTDKAIKRIDNMSMEEFEKKLHEFDYYPRRLKESKYNYLKRMGDLRSAGKNPCMFDGIKPGTVMGLVCPCSKCSVQC